jgi:hypothetical protein
MLRRKGERKFKLTLRPVLGASKHRQGGAR